MGIIFEPKLFFQVMYTNWWDPKYIHSVFDVFICACTLHSNPFLFWHDTNKTRDCGGAKISPHLKSLVLHLDPAQKNVGPLATWTNFFSTYIYGKNGKFAKIRRKQHLCFFGIIFFLSILSFLFFQT